MQWLGPLGVFAACALGAHALALFLAPGAIMDRAMAALEQRGVALHAFTTPERVTPQTQSIVRSSPDLYYALCRYDLSDPDAVLLVRMADWPDYQSLSFFDARTNNFKTIRGTGKPVTVRLRAPGSASGEGTIVSPTTKGVILIRRLAPTADQYAAAATASAGDACRL
jgi:uncharacterized membrane protein